MNQWWKAHEQSMNRSMNVWWKVGVRGWSGNETVMNNQRTNDENGVCGMCEWCANDENGVCGKWWRCAPRDLFIYILSCAFMYRQRTNDEIGVCGKWWRCVLGIYSFVCEGWRCALRDYIHLYTFMCFRIPAMCEWCANDENDMCGMCWRCWGYMGVCKWWKWGVRDVVEVRP